jgi:hypothetical protein
VVLIPQVYINIYNIVYTKPHVIKGGASPYWQALTQEHASGNWPGTHPAVITRLGHTTVRTVLDVHGHLYEGPDRGAADVLQSPWEPPHVDAL